jgi:small-conductance mechanosensitive channel
MENILGRELSQFLSAERIAALIRFVFLIAVGIPGVYFLSKWTRGYITKRYTAQRGMIAGKFVLYVGIFIIVFSIFNELGFQLTPLLGAAGVVGLAVGFASQTSVSNIISGLFLIAEQPFVVGDIIKVGDTTGQVLSIDMLSVKLRTFDNRFVRIPNETIVKSEVINVTHFPIRRLDLNIGVAYKENIGRVREALLEVARKNPLCLQEPEPVVIFSGFGSSSIDLLFAVWAAKSDWLKLKNSIQEEIKARFDQENIEIPPPSFAILRRGHAAVSGADC